MKSPQVIQIMLGFFVIFLIYKNVQKIYDYTWNILKEKVDEKGFIKTNMINVLNYCSMFIHFQFITILPFTLYYRSLCQIETITQEELVETFKVDSEQYGIMDDQQHETILLKSQILDSVERVFPFKLIRDYLTQNDENKAKLLPLGLVSSGFKTITVMLCLSIYSIIIQI
ncbi:UNKNOWN [Stylonychia lemnae]|uniref:Uncharacterized protein n=1 Tax=Stylonychia lemnae TaxID=5949 RepID=A0A078B4L3_STYLE|nr:UNKNOWN [Stylonychia lemnae]|eukprot:CDW89470.1 UNKNOWN [Stylonychia lemnae]